MSVLARGAIINSGDDVCLSASGFSVYAFSSAVI